MSSITNRSSERGQVLILFGGGIVALLIVAALAFDVGMMLVERRDQQNAADAAALAGARFVLSDAAKAEPAARQLAKDNGFDDADPNEVVNVYIPAIHGRYAGLPGFIEVQIQASRPSIFGGIIGRAVWPVGAFAVATNDNNLNFPFSMIALNETACAAIKVTGGGIVEAYASIQSNSTGAACSPPPPVSFQRGGGATIDVIAPDATCRAVGPIQDQGTGSMTCTKAPNSFALPDPLRDLPAPAPPSLAPAMVYAGSGPAPAIPKNCPGGSPAPNLGSPTLCKIPATGGPANHAWILYPGMYPGGIEVDKGRTVYLMPGIYWIGGGGLVVKGDSSIVSIAIATDAAPNVADATWGDPARCLAVSQIPPGTPYKCGVLIFNSSLPGSAAGPIDLNGGGATVKLSAFEVAAGNPNEIYNKIVIFQDRAVTTSVTLNGSASSAIVEGMMYVPEGQIKLNGNGGSLTVGQIIADTYDINGGGGNLKVLADAGFEATITAAGLVD